MYRWLCRSVFAGCAWAACNGCLDLIYTRRCLMFSYICFFLFCSFFLWGLFSCSRGSFRCEDMGMDECGCRWMMVFAVCVARDVISIVVVSCYGVDKVLGLKTELLLYSQIFFLFFFLFSFTLFMASFRLFQFFNLRISKRIRLK